MSKAERNNLLKEEKSSKRAEAIARLTEVRNKHISTLRERVNNRIIKQNSSLPICERKPFNPYWAEPKQDKVERVLYREDSVR